MKRTRVLIAAMLGLGLVFLMGGAANAQYPGPSTSSTSAGGSTTTTTPGPPPVDVLAGEDHTFFGDGCAANTPVYIVIDGSTTPPSSLPPPSFNTMVTSNADGSFTVVVHIPDNISLGSHTVVAYCADSAGMVQVQSRDINVTGRVSQTTGTSATGTSTTTGGVLPRTGAPSHLGTLLSIGAAAIVLGASFVYGATRRRPRSSGA